MKNTCESETFTGSKNSSATVSLKWVMAASSIFERALRPCSLGPGQAGTLISGLRPNVLLPRSCGADLEDYQSVFRTLWRVHRSWSLAVPAEFGTRVSHEIVLIVATSAWLHSVPALSFSTPFFITLPVSSGGGQATSMVRRGNF